MIFTGLRPNQKKLEALLRAAQKSEFSYPEIGQSVTMKEIPSKEYNIDRYHCVLGKGEQVFERAKEALQQWIHFDLGWVRIDAPMPSEGLTVPVCIRVFGFWTVNFCRVVYSQEELGQIRRWRFAYGTLEQHAEEGEERFTIEFNQQTEEVTYEIVAFSRPRHILSRIGYPLTRMLQKRFGKQSGKRMQQWIQISL
jgi:uncharacterized protein (UPF0548 family)